MRLCPCPIGPTSWGRLLPWTRRHYAANSIHRVLALLVTFMTLGLAFAMRTRLAWTAAGVIAAQAVLGGAGVILAEPLWIAIAHACLGQLQFGIVAAVVAQTFGVSLHLNRPALPAMLLAQTALGAAVRYGIIGVAAHMAGALIATLYILWAALSTLMHAMDDATRRRPSMVLLSLTFSQVFLGIAAYMSRIVYVNAPQPMPLMIFFTVAHVAFGALVFGAAVLFTMTARTQSISSAGGMVTA